MNVWQSTEENCQAQKGWKDMIMRFYIETKALTSYGQRYECLCMFSNFVRINIGTISILNWQAGYDKIQKVQWCHTRHVPF